jgi:hypothetical protein
MSHLRFALVPTLVIVLFGVGGCAAVSERTPSSTPSASAAAPVPDSATAARIQVSGEALTLVRTDGSTLRVLNYDSDPMAAIAALTTGIGAAPATTEFPASQCNLAEKHVAWGKGLTLNYRTDEATQFWVRSDATTTGSGIRVETTRGNAVGDPVKELIANSSDAVTQGEEDPSAFGIRVFFDLDSDQNGVVVDSDPKTLLISMISAPVNVNQDC